MKDTIRIVLDTDEGHHQDGVLDPDTIRIVLDEGHYQDGVLDTDEGHHQDSVLHTDQDGVGYG